MVFSFSKTLFPSQYYCGFPILQCCTELLCVLQHFFSSTFTLIMHRLLIKMFIDLTVISAWFFYELLYPESPSHSTKTYDKNFQTWILPLLGRGRGCSCSSPVCPSLKPWEICSWKSSTRLVLEFSKYLVILLDDKHLYRIIGTMEFGVQDRPEAIGSISFIFAFDSNGRSTDIFCCSVNKLLVVLF